MLNSASDIEDITSDKIIHECREQVKCSSTQEGNYNMSKQSYIKLLQCITMFLDFPKFV